MSETAYSVFPLTMVHPHFKPSEALPVPGTQMYDARGQLLRQDYQGTPQRLPPVTVNSEQEESYYEAQGYQRAGQVDPSAWVKAHAAAPPEDYKPVKYPRWAKDAHGTPVLYMTAQEDPEPEAEDEPEAIDPVEPPPPPASESDNLRAMVEEMNKTMRAMSEQMTEMKADNNRLAAEKAEVEALLDSATKPADPEPAKAEDTQPRGARRKVA